jgi:hypothetical protein
MNASLPMNIRMLGLEQKRYLVGLLELACQKLDITPSERESAENSYGAVCTWLSAGVNSYLANSSIYTQGSIRIGTAIRPIANNEFDVDLVCHVPNATHLTPKQVRDLIGDRLKANDTYKQMLEPLNRGWRLVYANRFHMDITPSINDSQLAGGILVPDRELQDWKESNPKGYAKWFEGIAINEPVFSIKEAKVRADVEAMPDEISFKGTLRRIVQLMKRHRDVWCSKQPPDSQEDAPISIILTTLATKSYKSLLVHQYENPLDLLIDVVEEMPKHIEQKVDAYGAREPWVTNPMNSLENFADKWKAKPEREVAFYKLHQEFLLDLNRLANKPGIDAIATGLSNLLDESISKSVMSEVASRINLSRNSRTLTTQGTGLITSITANSTRAIPTNTFFGR